MSMKRLRVLLLFGGRSAEHDVSRVSAASVAHALDPEKYEVLPVGITTDGRWLLAGEARRALRGGRDALPGAFEMMKRAFVAAGLPIARWLHFRDGHDADAFCSEVERSLGYPCFVKPANMGSSVGVSKARDRDELDDALARALTFDEWAIVEEAVDGREIEVGILGDDPPEASVPSEIVPGDEFYSYAEKYERSDAQLLVPAPLDRDRVEEVRGLAVRAFEACRCEAMARVDFFFEERGRGFLVNEVNTIPGFTSISQYPRMWQESGVAYSELLDRLIELARARHERRQRRAGRQRGE